MTADLNKCNRLAIFAFYNLKGEVLDYVVSYLTFLQEVCSKVVFVADSEVAQKELLKIKPYVCASLCQRHGEYDFGSYKRGINYCKEQDMLDDIDDLILCNDSCYCVDSFETSFDIMAKKQCDFWAMNLSKEAQPHLQSFFLVFKKSVFSNNSFFDYFNKVGHQEDFLKVVYSYEIPLKSFFEDLGFKADYIFAVDSDTTNPTFYPVLSMKANVPLVKRKIFLDREYLLLSTPIIYTLWYIRTHYPKAFKDIVSSFAGVNFYKLVLMNSYIQISPKIEKLKARILSFMKILGRFIYRKDVSKRGTVKHRIFKFPVLIYKKCGK